MFFNAEIKFMQQLITTYCIHLQITFPPLAGRTGKGTIPNVIISISVPAG